MYLRHSNVITIFFIAMFSQGLLLHANPVLTLQEGSLEEVRRDLSRARTDLSRDAFLWTPLMVAAGSNPHPEVIRFLIQSGQEINRVSLDSWSALHFAAAFNSEPAVVQTLVELGADLTHRSRDNWTVYYGASRYQDSTFTQQVRLPGSQTPAADLSIILPQTLNLAQPMTSQGEQPRPAIEVNDQYRVPWGLADWEICDLLPPPEPNFDMARWNQWFDQLDQKKLDNGLGMGSGSEMANPLSSTDNIPIFQGWSAIFFAARFNPNPRVFEALVSLGETPFQADESGTTPLEYARLYNPELSRFIPLPE
jgi:hypothetical protein